MIASQFKMEEKLSICYSISQLKMVEKLIICNQKLNKNLVDWMGRWMGGWFKAIGRIACSNQMLEKLFTKAIIDKMNNS